MDLNAYYKKLMDEGSAEWQMLPSVRYRKFVSRSKGRGRTRRYPVDVELVSFSGGKFMLLTRKNVDPYLNEALEGISVPADSNEFNYFVEMLRN